MNMAVISKNKFLLIISDIAIVIIAAFLSLLIKLDFVLPASFDLSTSFFILPFVLIKLLFLWIFNLYRGMYRYTSIWDLINIIKAIFSSSILMLILSILFSSYNYVLLSYVFLDFILCIVLISSFRLMIRIYFNHFKSFHRIEKAFRKKNIIIIGAGYSGQDIARQIMNNSNYNFNLIGFLDDDISKIGKILHGVKVIGPLSSLLDEKLVFDESLICIPSANLVEMKAIINYCKKSGKPFKTLPSLSGLIEGRVSVSQLREVSVTDLLGREEIILDKNSIKNFILGKRIIVTGAGGSIGSELVRQCISFNPKLLIMLDISEFNLFQIEREVLSINSSIKFQSILCDIRDKSSLENIFNEFKPHVVFHAAAYKHVPIQEKFPQEAIKTNIFGSINLIEVAKHYNAEKFVLVSTDKAVRPTNVMGATKE